MGSEEFFIIWNNHHRSVVGAFGRYLAEETLVDCTVVAEGECLKAHRLVLSACSSYFETLFSQEMYKEKIVVMEEIKFQDLKSLIAFMYDGQITIPKIKLRDYVKAAEFLQIRGLPRELLLNCLREATENSVLCGKEGVTLQTSDKLMGSSAMGGESSEFRWNCSSSGKQQDEEPSTCMRMDLPEENVHLQHQYFWESVSKTETAKFPGEKEPSVEPKEELDVEDTPIWDSEDENTCTVTDVSLATAGEVIRSELPPVPSTISSRNGFASSSLIVEKDSETSILKFSSVTATTPSTNTAHSTTFVPNVTTEQSGCAMELPFSCEQTEMTEQIICVNKEPLEKTDVITAVISLESESRVDATHEMWVEELPYCEGQKLRIEMDSAVTCNEQTTILDLDATVFADNSQSAVWPNDTCKTHASACVEAQRVRKEVHSLEIKKETENDEECVTGECSKVAVDDSTVDKVVESGVSVVEIDEDYVIKEEHVMEGQEIVETMERTLDADVAVKKSEGEEVDSIPLLERISMMLQRQSHRCLKCASVFSSVNELRLHVRNMHKEKGSKRCDVCEVTFTYRSQLMIHMRKHTNERPFKCDICSRAFKLRCSLIRHIRAHSGKGLFQCEVCERSFWHRSALAQHKRTHTGERPFKCNVCSASFIQRSYLKIHKQIHTGERPFQCEVCKRSFRHMTSLARHKRTHTAERPFKCNVCSVSFNQKSSLNCHKLIHTGERPFQCEECERSFRHSTTLTNHKRTHTGERPFKCDVCSVSFNQKSGLDCHKLIHTSERPFQCEECEKSYCRRSSLAKHKRTHTGERPFKCDICNRAFSVKFTLIKHMCTHTGDGPFQCDVCKKSFRRKDCLSLHKRTHTRELLCDICKSSFVCKSSLMAHMRIHTGERPYPCSICKKSFSRKGNLTEHMRTHTGERPFQCNVCQKSFTQKCILIKHLCTHTGECPFQCNVCRKSFRHKSNLSSHMCTHTGQRLF